MISNFGNNNSQAGSESPLPSPRFSRYIRPQGPSDSNAAGASSSEKSASIASPYSPRVGRICSQNPSVNIGKPWSIHRYDAGKWCCCKTNLVNINGSRKLEPVKRWQKALQSDVVPLKYLNIFTLRELNLSCRLAWRRISHTPRLPIYGSLEK